MGWLTDNPVAKVSKEKVQNLVERWLTSEEEEHLMRVAPPWLQRVVHFALQTGLRQGELLNLKWSQVDLFRRTLTILEQKNKAVDTLPLNELVVEVLKTQAKVRHLQSNYVFPNGRGKRKDARNLIRAFEHACVAAHVMDFRFHDLRHAVGAGGRGSLHGPKTGSVEDDHDGGALRSPLSREPAARY